MSAKDIYNHRLIYGGFAYSLSGEINIDPDLTKNFWFFENLFYGRVREDSGQISIIAPKKNLLSGLKNTTNTSPAKALDFVADAFESLRLDMWNSKPVRLENSQPEASRYLSKPTIHSGYVDYLTSFKKIQSDINQRFMLYSDLLKDETDLIFSFEEFVPFFMNFLEKYVETGPVTRSSYLISKGASPLSSGLCLEISPLKHSEDKEKSEHFLDDENFEFYKVLAASKGFAIDKNAPWRLVADIASSQMLEYAQKRVPSISTAQDILDYYFEDTRDTYDELEDLKSFMIQSYNVFVTANPVVSEKNITRKKAETTYVYRKLKTGEIWTGQVHYHPENGYMTGARHVSTSHDLLVREEIPFTHRKRKREIFETINSRYGLHFWYDKYLRIKNIEFGLGYEKQELAKLINYAVDLESSFDRSRSMGYIKKRMTPIISSEGSLARTSLKNKDNPKEESRALARSLNKLIY